MAASPAPSMLVVGGGDVATALAGIAETLEWPCHITDELTDAVDALDVSDVVVVLSHHEGIDAPVLAAALHRDHAYIGAMGSRRTQARRREQMVADGVPEESLASIHGPAGLDIGADAPAEIAVSILAEVVGVLRGVTGGSLSDRDGPVHLLMEPGTALCPAPASEHH